MEVFMAAEFGDYDDNLEAFTVALMHIKRGFVPEGLELLQDLLNFIIQTGETKSLKWILPKLRFIEQHGCKPEHLFGKQKKSWNELHTGSEKATATWQVPAM
jgi:hypothetical protein